MRIVKDENLFYIQQSNAEYIKSTGIVRAEHDATLCKFSDIFYKGMHSFETVELAQAKIDEIEDGLEVSFIPNKAHHNLSSL